MAYAEAMNNIATSTTGFRPMESTRAPTSGEMAISVKAPALEAVAKAFVAYALPKSATRFGAGYRDTIESARMKKTVPTKRASCVDCAAEVAQGIRDFARAV